MPAGQYPFRCWLIRDVDIDRCTSENFELHIHHPMPPSPPFPPLPAFPPAPPLPPPYAPGEGPRFVPDRESCGLDGHEPTYTELTEPIELYHAWWHCHLLENGPYTALADTFSSPARLRDSIWWDYLDGVYGSSTLRYPISIGWLCYFHTNLLPKVEIPMAPASGNRLWNSDAYAYGDFKLGQYPLQPSDIWRSYRQKNFKFDDYLQTVMTRGLPSHSLVEVTHTCCDPWGEGLWHYLQPGSGIFLNLGNTIITGDGVPGCGGTVADRVACLLGKGYDTWQLPRIYEGGTKLYEIVNLRDRHSQGDGCFDATQSAGMYFKGYDGSLPCRCKPNGGGWWNPINCDG